MFKKISKHYLHILNHWQSEITVQTLKEFTKEWDKHTLYWSFKKKLKDK